MPKSKPTKLTSNEDLARVYETYTPELRGFVRRRVVSIEEVEDIVQDVFYNLARIDLLASPIEYISAWLYRAATNRIIDRSRKKREEPLPPLPAVFADSSDEPDTAFLDGIIRDEIARALDELPPEQRTVFELTEYDGLSYKEVAASTGIPVATLLSRKHYAVLHLRRALAGLMED